MGTTTGIEWTDATWNPLRGCRRVSPGCTNCYAEAIAARFSGPGQPYEGLAVRTPQGPRWTGKINLVPDKLEDPLHWKKPRRVFVNSMSDLFHEDVPDEFIDRVFDVMWRTPRHTFQILTKRPERMVEYVRSRASARAFGWTDVEREPLSPGKFVSFDDLYYRNQCGYKGSELYSCLHPTKGERRGEEDSCEQCDCPVAFEVTDRESLTKIGVEEDYEFDEDGFADDSSWMEIANRPLHAACANVWLGFSAESQETYEKRFRHFRQLRWILGPYFTLFVSLEPLLGPIDFRLRYRADNQEDSGLNHSGLKGHTFPHGGQDVSVPYLNWVIVGGESGPNARPMHPQWARDIRDQCVAAGVPFLFKQWGEYGAGSVTASGEPCFREFPSHQKWVQKASTWVNGGICLDADGRPCLRGADFQTATYPVTIMHRVGKKAAGRMLDGQTWDEFPEVTL